MLSAAAGVHSGFVQEKDTLLRRSWPRWKERQSQILTWEEETDLPHRLRNSSRSWHRLDSTTFLLLHSVSGSANSSEEGQSLCLGWFNFPSPATIRQCFPVRWSTSAPSWQLLWSWPLLPGEILFSMPAFPAPPGVTFGTARPPGELQFSKGP